MVFFYFTLVFLYSIFNIYFANIAYLAILCKDIIVNGKFPVAPNKLAQLSYLLFIVWTTISTIAYSMETGELTARIIIQFVFTVMYFVLIVPIKFNIEKFELWTYRFSLLMSLFILLLYIYYYMSSPNLLADDLWASRYIPGWPNSTPYPLLMGIWLSFRKNFHISGKAILFVGLFLTGSRIALLGGLIIIFYFLLKRMKYKKSYAVYVIMFITVGVLGINYMISKDPLFIMKMTVSWDRVDIFYTTMSYLEHRPFLGFGGNTIDQLTHIEISHMPAKNWGHTHNWVLEMLLRYGIIGMLLFTVFIVSIFVKIKDKEKRFMFAFLLALALFQTYIRDFVFLFYLLYLSTNTDKGYIKKEQTI